MCYCVYVCTWMFVEVCEREREIEGAHDKVHV